MSSSTVLTVTGIDSGTATTVSASAPIGGTTAVTVFIAEASGDCTGADIMLQVSPDNSTWHESGGRTGVIAARANASFNVDSTAVDFVRILIKTGSSIASSCNIVVQAK